MKRKAADISESSSSPAPKPAKTSHPASKPPKHQQSPNSPPTAHLPASHPRPHHPATTATAPQTPAQQQNPGNEPMPLKGINIHLHSSLPHLQKRLPLLRSKIGDLGGTCTPHIHTPGITHIILPTKPSAAAASTIPPDPALSIVTEEWLTQTLSIRQHAPEAKYTYNPPPKPRSPPPPLLTPPSHPTRGNTSPDNPTYRNFTPLSPDPSTPHPHPPIRIITYNILADKYASGGRSHTHCPIAHRVWQSRGPRLKAELQHYDPHLICLQEVDEPIWERDLKLWFEGQGYRGWYFGRAYNSSRPGSPEGVVLLYRTSAFQAISHRTIRFADHVPGDDKSSAYAGSFWAAVQAKQEGAVMALLRHTATRVLLAAVSTHLWYDPKWPDLKLAQTHILCQQVNKFITSTSPRGLATPVIIGGDFNSLPIKHKSDAFDRILPNNPLQSGVYTLLSSGSLTSSHPHHPYRQNRISPDPEALRSTAFDSAGLKLQSSWVLGKGHEPPFTNRHQSFAGCIDYIWLTPHWRVVGLLEMPYTYDPQCIDPFQVAFPFTPDERWSSDHLAVGAEVVLQPLEGGEGA